MAGVTTVALLERKPGISRSLFSRYWRDVHGVMAARIPGFDSYTQNHVTPLGDSEPFEGIAIVTFADEAHRQGLIESEVTRHIHRDEQNVFRRALLYNLAAGDSRSLSDGPGGTEIFFVVPHGQDGVAIANGIAGRATVDLHDLTSGDPAGWNDTDVGAGRRFVALIHARWSGDAAAYAAASEVVAASGGAVAAYRLDERHVMVEHGFPTAVGLRGLDAVRTIEEAGAVNQLEREVVTAIYGKLGSGAR